MKTIILSFIMVVFSSKASAFDEKIKSFSTSVNVLNTITENYSKNRDVFKDGDYSSYTLYRALILNDVIQNSYTNIEFVEIYCANDSSDLVNLLKWEISVYSSYDKLVKKADCPDMTKLYKTLMEKYFLDTDYTDSFVKYYYYLKNNKNNELSLQWSILNTNLYKRADIEISDILIDVQEEIAKKTNMSKGLWNASIISAKNGSEKGFRYLLGFFEEGSMDQNFIIIIKRLL